jgi:septal ring factor EnvC (AmiA/AmiB activator)
MSDYESMTLHECEEAWDRMETEAVRVQEEKREIKSQIEALEERFNALQDFTRQQDMDALNAAIARKYMEVRRERPSPNVMLGDD